MANATAFLFPIWSRDRPASPHSPHRRPPDAHRSPPCVGLGFERLDALVDRFAGFRREYFQRDIERAAIHGGSGLFVFFDGEVILGLQHGARDGVWRKCWMSEKARRSRSRNEEAFRFDPLSARWSSGAGKSRMTPGENFDETAVANVLRDEPRRSPVDAETVTHKNDGGVRVVQYVLRLRRDARDAFSSCSRDAPREQPSGSGIAKADVLVRAEIMWRLGSASRFQIVGRRARDPRMRIHPLRLVSGQAVERAGPGCHICLTNPMEARMSKTWLITGSLLGAGDNLFATARNTAASRTCPMSTPPRCSCGDSM